MCYILNNTDMIRRHFKSELLKSTEDVELFKKFLRVCSVGGSSPAATGASQGPRGSLVLPTAGSHPGVPTDAQLTLAK